MGRIVDHFREHYIPPVKDLVAGVILTVITTTGTIIWAVKDELLGPHLILLVIAVIGVTLLAINQFREFFKRIEDTPTNEQLSLQLREWLYKHQFPVTNEESESAHFQFSVESYDYRFSVIRPKNDPEKLIFMTGVTIAGPLKTSIDALSYNEKKDLIIDIRIKLLEYGLSYKYVALPLERIEIQHYIPITKGTVSEYDFIRAVQYVSNGLELLRGVIGKVQEMDDNDYNR